MKKTLSAPRLGVLFCSLTVFFLQTRPAQASENDEAVSDFASSQEFHGRWCGPTGEWSSVLIPDEWPDSCNAYTRNAHFYEGCKAHDSCYSMRGAVRAECDNKLHDDLRKECKKAFFTMVCKPALVQCRGVARVYFEAVKEWGAEAFKHAQQQNTP